VNGLAAARLPRLRAALSRHVDSGAVPAVVALVSRGADIHVETLGSLAIGGPPVRRDAIFRIASMSKPVTAAAAMILVEEGRLRLDDPVDPWLPELADRRVLKRLDGPLDDTVPARRPITLRDLMTFRLGMGLIMAPPGSYPMQAAVAAAGLAPGPSPSSLGPDAWMRALGGLPLLHQPGEAWTYHTGSEVLGVLIARVAGQSLGGFLGERIFAPLGMHDTGFHVPAEKLDRFTTSYLPGAESLEVFDAPQGGAWSRPPAFESGGGGLACTADDYLAFCRMMLAKGAYDTPAGRGRILSRPAVALMTAEVLTAAEKAANEIFFEGHGGWGFGMAVNTTRRELWTSPGRFGWDGGLGTSGWSDPAEDLAGVLLTTRAMSSPAPPAVFTDFWTAAYQAIDD
jgi:CubicO group peptidase (beta-lactamase class C family)